jgi:HAE1 family hydrophobic/amphiphilic exporter-1
VQNRVAQENVELPAGIAKQGNTEYTIRTVGYFASVAEAAQIPIGNSNGSLVTLGMVANVSDSHQETRISTRINGNPAVGITITETTEANTVATTNAVKEKVAQVQKLYPQLKFNLGYQQGGFIENSIDDLKTSAMIGGSLAIIILLFFLRNFRSTLVVALSIPISIISTFALIYFCGFTLNTISLSGLALATGLIVDDAVVVLENIFRHIERDKRRAADAAVSGTNEITPAVVASTFTVMIVFLPLLLIKGQTGQTFTQFAFVVIFSIAISLLDATTVVPMLASRLISEEEVEEEAHPELRAARGKKDSLLMKGFNWFGRKFTALDAAYHRSLTWALKHRWLVLGGAIGITALSLLLAPMIGTEMLPQTDSGDFTVNVKLPVGTAYSTTDTTMRQVEKILLGNPDVQMVFSASGTNLSIRGASTTQIGYQGGATVRLKDDRKHSTSDVIKTLQKQMSRVPGARVLMTPYDLVTQILTGGATNMEVDVFGQDQNVVTAKANEVADVMRQVPGLESVDLGVQDATPELQWKVDRSKALSLGVSFQDIANVLSTATNGTLTTYYQDGGFQYPIYVQVPEGLRKSPDQLKNLPLTPSLLPGVANPKPILLGQVAIPVYTLGPNEITRLNRQRYIAVTGRVADRSASEVQADIGKALTKVQFPQGTYWDYGVNQKRQGEEFSGLGLAVFLAIALIYMLLASQFESFIYPLVVLMSVPLCAVGVILALFLTGRAFGITAFIGLLMLIGIVVKNGILLVDYTTQLRGRGVPRDEAILTAAPTRLRPILMTTFAAILGMLPLAMALGKGSETQAPLATAVIGGLSTSTLLTLFVVPVVYTLFDDLAKRLKKDKRDLAPSSAIGPSIAAIEKRNEPPAPSSEPVEVDHRG